MPKPYDDAMKKLVGGNPQDFLSWVLDKAEFMQQLPYELSVENVYADGLIEAMFVGKRTLVHLEFQSSYDLRIGERLLEYNVLASRQYSYLPVYSYVIYLKDCGSVPQSPFTRNSPVGEEVIRFQYGSIELHRITSREMQQTDLVGLLPLLPLTKDGAKREIIEDMITRLVAAEQTESLWIGYALAAKVMKHDLQWLRRRFAVFSDFLRDSPVYQEVLEEGLEKGLETGLARGREEGLQQELQRQRDTLINITLDRFPELVRQMKKEASDVDDPAMLSRLIVKLSTARTVEEVKYLLLLLADDPDRLEN